MPSRSDAPALTPLDQTDRLLIDALARCSFLPGSADKYFSRRMKLVAARTYDVVMTARQRSRLNALVYRYRRQISAQVVAKAALRLAEEQATFRLQVREVPTAVVPTNAVRNPLDALFPKGNGEAA